MSKIYTEKGLAELATEVANQIAGHENIYLSGELGSGKTTFTQLLLKALAGKDELATSPSFQLVNEYLLPEGRKLYHIDLYRLTAPDDLSPLGLEEYLADPQAVVVIEWPERGENILPKPHLHFHFDHRTPTTRIVTALHD